MDDTALRLATWELFLDVGTCEILDAGIDGVENVPSWPSQTVGGGKVAIGPLVRLALAPHVVDEGPAAVLARHVTPGTVVAIASGEHRGAGLGSRLAMRAQVSGAVAVVTDGNVRDALALGRLPIAVWAAGTTPSNGGGGTYTPQTGISALFGVTWQDGDWYAQDSDGALRIARYAVDVIVSRFGRA